MEEDQGVVGAPRRSPARNLSCTGGIFRSVNANTQTHAPADAFVIPCAQCGQKNRVLRARAAENPSCGHCKKPVFSDHPVAGSDATWARDVEASPVPVLVDFWAPWCGPCRAIAPALEQIAKERTGKLKVVKINVDDNPTLSARFAIQSIPTLMVFRDGQVADQIRGAMPKSALDARLARLGV